MGFSKLEVVIPTIKLDVVRKALSGLGVNGITVLPASGCGIQNGAYEYEEKKHETMDLLSKQMVMVVVEDSILIKVIESLKKALHTGHIGDGKIFISPVSNVIRVRTGEEGDKALN